MGIACTMSRILQKNCGVVEDPTPGGHQLCTGFHPDATHSRTWIVDELPSGWVTPLTINWGDGTIDVSGDGEDAHEYDAPGVYVITATDSEGRTCTVSVTVPHA